MMATTSKRLIRLKRPRILRISAPDAEVARKCDGVHMQDDCGDLRSPRRTVKVRPTLERGPPYIGTRSALHWNEVRPTLERGPPYIGTRSALPWNEVRPTLERGAPYIGTRSALHWN